MEKKKAEIAIPEIITFDKNAHEAQNASATKLTDPKASELLGTAPPPKQPAQIQ